MDKSKTKIEEQLSRKKNIELIETIIKLKKMKDGVMIANSLSSPRRKKIEMNLTKINEFSKEGDVIIIPGKVLSQGEIDKKIKIGAVSFSQKAREKISKSKSTCLSIMEIIRENPQLKGVKVLK